MTSSPKKLENPFKKKHGPRLAPNNLESEISSKEGPGWRKRGKKIQ